MDTLREDELAGSLKAATLAFTTSGAGESSSSGERLALDGVEFLLPIAFCLTKPSLSTLTG